MGHFRSRYMQNANGRCLFSNCRQLLPKFSCHLIADNEIKRYKDDNLSKYTYQNPYFDSEWVCLTSVRSDWGCSSCNPDQNSSAFSGVYEIPYKSADLWKLICIFIRKRDEEDKSDHSRRAPWRWDAGRGTTFINAWLLVSWAMENLKALKAEQNPERQVEAQACYVWHPLPNVQMRSVPAAPWSVCAACH